MNKIIVIGGGVGPMAGVDLHRRIIERTRTNGTDQDHLSVLHASFPALVPDRTEALMEGQPELPALAMARILLAAEQSCRSMGAAAVAGIPCNTFHAAPVWDRFTAELTRQGSRLELLHMIDETLRQIKKRLDSPAVIGVIATTGTRNSRVFDDRLAAEGFEAIHPEDQEEVHKAIYHPDWGLKARTPASRQAAGRIYTALDELCSRGAKAVILGCTELPLAVPETVYQGAVLINPVEILAGSLIEAAAPGRTS